MRIILILMILTVGMRLSFSEESQILSARQIQDTIREYILKDSEYSASDLLVNYKSHLSDEILPLGEVEIKVSSSNLKLLGFVPVKVEIFLDARLYRSLTVYLEVDVKTKVFMATKWIKRYQPLDETNAIPIESRLSKVPLDAVLKEEDLKEKVARVAISKGRMITYSMISFPPIIRNGEVVEVILERENLRITTKGIALADAQEDQSVKVRLLDSKREIYAKPISEKKVLVK